MSGQGGDAQLDLAATPTRVRELADGLSLSEAARARALALLGVPPDAATWAQALDRFLLALGMLLLLAGIAAFFAWNWADLPRFAKFGLLQAGLVGAVALAWWRGLDTPSGRAALFAAAFLVGLLLAVFGQTYQTGADPYGLFLFWALLILGWALIGRQAAIWMLWILLVNLAFTMYWDQILFPGDDLARQLAEFAGPLFRLLAAMTDFRLAQWVFGLNLLVLLAWETLAARGIGWMQGRWLPRVVAVMALSAIVTATLAVIFLTLADAGELVMRLVPLWFAVFALVCLWYYRERRQDLFMLAACLLAVIIVVTAYVASLGDGYEHALLLSLLLIGQTAGATLWLRATARAWRSES